MKQSLGVSFKRLVAATLACILTVSVVHPEGIVYAEQALNVGGYSVEEPHLIINQVYGSEGKSEYVSHDFIELYNPTGEDVELEGWSVQYRASAAGRDTASWNKLDLKGTISSNYSYLIRCAESTAYTRTDRIISDYDISWDIPLYNKGLSVVLLSSNALLPSDSIVFDNEYSVPAVNEYVDMLSVAGNDGRAKQVPETYEKAVQAWQSKKIGIVRKDFADTDDNASDIKKADYSAANVSDIFPKSTSYGKWGITVGDLELIRKDVPKYYDVYCTAESSGSLTQILVEVDAAIERQENDKVILYGLKGRLKTAIAELVYKHDETIPQVYLSTDNGQGRSYGTTLTKAMGYVPSSVVIADTDGSLEACDYAAQIKVRGNSTAVAPKKPYNIKLGQSRSLFGMKKSKKWVLLADYFDPTGLRNSTAFHIADEMGFLAPLFQRVEVWMDGEFRGTYLLTEKVDSCVEIDNKGFFVEMDREDRTEVGNIYFYTDSGLYFRLRDPEDGTDEQIADIIGTMNEFERVISGGNYCEAKTIMDIDSFVDYYILNEFIKNIDFGVSVFLYYDDGKMKAGPAWDQDMSLGYAYSSPTGEVIADCHYFKLLMRQQWFRVKVYNRYKDLSSVFKTLYITNGWIDKQVECHKDAFQRNYEIWPFFGGPASHEENIARLKRWIDSRQAWFDEYAETLGTCISEEDDLYYYKDGVRTAAGLILYEGEYYYVGDGGKVMTGTVEVVNTNGLKIPAGTYEFNDKGIMQNVPLKYEAVHVDGKNPSCTADGYEEYWKVERIGKLYSDADCTKRISNPVVKPAPGHSWNEGEITTEPTVFEEGEMTYTCTVCGATKTEPISAAVVKPPVPVSGLVYNGDSRVLVSAGSAAGTQLSYVVGTDDSEAPETGWSTDLPTAVNAGTWYVWYKALGVKTYGDTEAHCKEVKISPRTLSVNAIPAGKTYGDQNPALTFTTEGLVDGDSVSGNLARAEGNDVGTYEISQGSLTAGDNYTITYTPADFTISAKPLSIKAIPSGKVYGTQDPTLTYTTEGLAEGDSVSGTLARAEGEDAGTYAISQGTLSAGENYDESFVGAEFIISQADSRVGTIPEGKDIAYNGQFQTLVVPGEGEGGTLCYAVGSDTFNEPDSSAYCEDSPSALEIGNYHIWYKVFGDRNHKDTKAECLTSYIRKGCNILLVNADGAERNTYETVYTGSAITPEVRIYDNGRLLSEQRDYTVSYRNNKDAYFLTPADPEFNASKAPSVTVKMKGVYSDSRTVYFTISKADISQAAGSDLSVSYTGKAQKPKPSLIYQDKALKVGKDYELRITGTCVDPGDYPVAIVGKGNFTGEKEIVFSIAGKNSVPVSKMSVSLDRKSYEYTGARITPQVKVRANGRELTSDKDFTVVYADNRSVGTGYVTLSGNGIYVGSRTVAFKITGTVMKQVKILGANGSVDYVPEDKTYTGNRQIQDTQSYVLKTKGGTALVEGRDYTVSYKGNLNAGTAEMMFTGIPEAGFTGTVKKRFKILPVSVKNSSVFIEKQIKTPLMLSGSVPVPTISFNGMELTEGVDYVLTYSNNKKLSSPKNKPSYIVKGIGNYKDLSDRIPFEIVPASLDGGGIFISAPDKAWVDAKDNYRQKTRLIDASGKALRENKDYSLRYYLGAPDGVELHPGDKAAKDSVIFVIAEAVQNGNYVDIATASFRLADKDKVKSIEKAGVRISNKDHTGYAVIPDGKDITMTLGKTPIAMTDGTGDGYRLVSCYDNVRRGSSVVIFEGTGNCSGLRVARFKIGRLSIGTLLGR